MSTIYFENETYPGEALDANEQALLLNNLYANIAGESSLMLRLFRDNEAKILAAAQIAKDKLKVRFGGQLAGDGEFGLRLIRSLDILRTTGATETPNLDWEFTFASGSDYWIGFGTDNLTAANVDRRIGCIIVLGIAFTQGGSPVVEDVYPQIGGNVYPIQVIRHAWVADNPNGVRLARIRPWLLPQGQTALIQVRTRGAGANQLVLVGVTFARGDFMRLLAPTTVQL